MTLSDKSAIKRVTSSLWWPHPPSAVATGPGNDNDVEKVPGMLNCRSERGIRRRRREGGRDGTREVRKEGRKEVTILMKKRERAE